MTALRYLMTAVLLTALTACSSIPLTTMVKLMNLNPLTTNPKKLLVAVTGDEDIEITSGDVVLDFSFRTDDPNVSFNHHFPVVTYPNYAVPSELQDEIDSGERITIMHLSDTDAATMLADQQTIKRYREKHENGGAGSINVRLVSACSNSREAPENSELNVYLKTENDTEFFLFLEDIDLESLDEAAGCDAGR